MAGRNLGEAFVSILPDARLFRTQLLAKLKQALAGVDAPIPVSLDTKRALADLAALKKAIAEAADMKVRLDPGSAMQAAIMLRQIMARAGLADFLDINMPIGRIAAQLQLLRRMVNQNNLSDIVGINVDKSKVAAAVASIGKMSESIPVNFNVGKLAQIALPSGTEVVHLALDRTAYTAGIIAAVAEAGELQRVLNSLEVKADFTAFDAEIIDVALPGVETLQKSLADLKAEADFTILDAEIVSESKVLDGFTRPRVIEITEVITKAMATTGGTGTDVVPAMNFTEMLHGATETTGAIDKLTASKDRLSKDITKDLNPAVASSGVRFGGWLGVLGLAIGATRLWHVVLAAAIETIVAVTTAAAAAAVGIAALASTFIDVRNHITAVNQVNSALGDQIPVLGADFRNYAESVTNSSQALEIYGGLINAVKGQTGGLIPIARQVVTLFDDWVARIDLWIGNQKNFSSVLQTGVNFLSQFGQVFGHLFEAFANLLAKEPGVAHFMLDIINAAAQLLDWISKLPQPILATALAIHAFYTYGTVAAAALGRLPGPLGAIGRAVAGLGGPATLVLAALAAGAFELSRAWDSASTGVQKDINAINMALSQMPASQALSAISLDIGTINAKMSSLNTSAIVAGWQGVSSVFQRLDDQYQAVGRNLATSVDTSKTFAQQASAAWHAVFNFFAGGLNQSASATVQLQHDMAAYKTEIDALLGDQQKLVTVMGDLITGNDKFGVATHSVASALALMDLAGVRAGDSMALMLQKVNNLVTGYQAMSVQGNLLNGAVLAITFSTEQQSSKITQLTGAYTAWFNTITGGISTFDTFAQQVGGLYQSLTTGGLRLRDSNGRVTSSLTLLGTSATNTKVSMTGLNSASITAQQTFLQTASAAQNQYNSLVTLASAAGLGAKGTTMLTQAMNDYMLLLIPATKGNAALQQTLVSMYQEVNPNVTSFIQLKKAVGDNQAPLQNLDKITTTLTIDAGNLTKDVQNLATALHQDLNAAMAQVILTETGGLKPMEDLYAAVKTTGLNSQATATQALKLGQQFLTLTGNTSDAKAEFVTFAEQGLKLTQAQADALWNEIKTKLQPVVAGTGQTAVQAANQIVNNFVTSLQKIGFTIPGVRTDVQNFTAAVQATGDTSTRTAGARAKLIADLESSGIQANVAKSLVNGLQGQINAMHGKTVSVGVVGSGSGKITFAEQNIKNAQTGFLEFHAAGGQVRGPGGPRSDNVLAALSPGEYVINAASAQKIGYSSLDKINKFAGGGLVDSYGVLSGTGQDFVGTAEQQFAQAAETSAAQAMIADMQAKVAAAAALAAGTPVAYSKVAGVTQWEGTALRALAMLGLPAGDLPTVMSQILTESGGNPNAINLTDINAQQGDPSRGLLQLIMTTFQAYRNPGLSSNIYDPLANIYAGLHYAESRYGNPGWLSVLGHGHGYDSGGWLPPGKSIAVNNTGQYERVTPPGGSGKLTPGEAAICARLDALIGVTGQQGHKFAGALNSVAGSAAQRGSYSTRRG